MVDNVTRVDITNVAKTSKAYDTTFGLSDKEKETTSPGLVEA